MCDDDNIFDIRLLSAGELSMKPERPGTIVIYGDAPALKRDVSSIRSMLLSDPGREVSFFPYRAVFRQEEYPEEEGEAIVVCHIYALAALEPLYVIGRTTREMLLPAVFAVMQEAEKYMRRMAEETLVMAAMEYPSLYRDTIEHTIRPGSRRNPAFLHEFNVDSDDDLRSSHEKGMLYGVAPMPSMARCPERESCKYNSRRVSAAARKATFCNLPSRLSAVYEHENPEEMEIVRQTLSSMTPEEFMAVFFEMSKRKAGILKDFHATAISSASKYEIHVRRWCESFSKDFKDKYLYCIYLKPPKGKEMPVVFENYPSYCIYMLHILDRAQRRDDVTQLSLDEVRFHFRSLYKTILQENDTKIEALYTNMARRQNPSDGKWRKGRYDDYLKDICDTMESLVGEIDSIPLKIGRQRFLGVVPERIFIDEKLARFNLLYI